MDTPLHSVGSTDHAADETAVVVVVERRQAATREAQQHFVRCLARLAARRMFADALAETKPDLVDPT